MMPLRTLQCLIVLLLAATASAQIEPDDFIDPRQYEGRVFISRLVLGGGVNLSDHYRVIDQNVGFVHLTNSLYWARFQFNYKHSEFGGDRGPVDVQQCGCDPTIFFPTPVPGAPPPAPPAGAVDTLQAAWYARAGSGPQRVMLRYELTASRRTIDTVVRSVATGEIVSRRSGHELSLGLDADTYLRIYGRDLFGTLHFARTASHGTTDHQSQNEIVYTSHLPGGVLFGEVLFRPALAVGAVSDRRSTAINVINPSFETLFHHRKSQVNFHLVWSPQFMNSEARGWETTHQIALFVDRALIVKLFGHRAEKE